MIATAELEAALESEVLARRPYRYATSAHLELVDVRWSDGDERTLLLKCTSRSSFLDEARGAKPAFVHDPAREVTVYRSVLSAVGLPTARCHAAVADGERSWLLLEKVDGIELWQVGELARWAAVAAWLPDMHRALSSVVARAPLLRHGPALWRRFLRRAQRSVGDARMPRIARCHPSVVEELAALPVGVVHGEFYPSNVLVAGERICPVDWEMAGRGTPLLDVAALLSGWPPEERLQLLRAYAGTAGVIDEVALARHVALCQLQLCVQWLGWSKRWNPPPEHARDWLTEAVGLADELGL